ncbi:MAG: 2-aminoadipate transaminase [Kosmotogales bacterium]|nr:2-aminoadipate transaminase [Kosmotogales bacterium]
MRIEMYSHNAKRMKSNIIRELLKYTMEPEMISFGGGAPDPETFPRNELSEIARDVLKNEYKVCLQYGTTEGDKLLREEYFKLLESRDGITGLNLKNMIVVSGSQSSLDLISKVFLDHDSIYFISKPAYLGAASAFSIFSRNNEDLVLKDDGMDLDTLEKRLEEIKQKGDLLKVKFVYVVPNFHNPAGITLSLEKRKRLVDICERYDILIIEDDPYGSLRYNGESLPSLFKLGSYNRVLLLKTFSKVLSPGMRLGFIIGREDIIQAFIKAKQSTDLCTSSLTQRIAARYLQRYGLYSTIDETIKLYRRKKDIMLEELQEQFKDIPMKWTKPEGGLFVWATLPEEFDTHEMLDIALENRIIYIPGDAFSVQNGCNNSMRLSFCLPPEEDIVEGVKRLKKTILAYGNKKGLL